MTVLLTGAAGRIGSDLTARLPAFGWTVRGFDRTAADGGGHRRHHVARRPGCGDGTASPPSCTWPGCRPRRRGRCCARRTSTARSRSSRRPGAHGVDACRLRVVHPCHRVHARWRRACRRTAPPRPDTLYGVSKVFGEVLGRYYADRYGMRVACLRIGTFGERPADPTSLSTWLSLGDCARLVDACLRTAALSYAVLWGFSANTRRTWPLDDALRPRLPPRGRRRGSTPTRLPDGAVLPVRRAAGRRVHQCWFRHRRGAGAVMMSDRTADQVQALDRRRGRRRGGGGTARRCSPRATTPNSPTGSAGR